MFKTFAGGVVAVLVLIAIIAGFMQILAPTATLAWPNCVNQAADCYRWCHNQGSTVDPSSGVCCWHNYPIGCKCLNENTWYCINPPPEQ